MRPIRWVRRTIDAAETRAVDAFARWFASRRATSSIFILSTIWAGFVVWHPTVGDLLLLSMVLTWTSWVTQAPLANVAFMSEQRARQADVSATKLEEDQLLLMRAVHDTINLLVAQDQMQAATLEKITSFIDYIDGFTKGQWEAYRADEDAEKLHWLRVEGMLDRIADKVGVE